MEPSTEDKIYLRAKAKVKQLKDFYDHFRTFCITLPFIIWADVNYTPEIAWSIPALALWGTAIAIHWLFIMDRVPFFNRKWEERKIREIMEQNNKKQGVQSALREAGHQSNQNNQ